MTTTPVKLWRRQKHIRSLIGKSGVIEQWSIIRIPAKGFTSEAPYPLVLVTLADNSKMIGQLVDWETEDLKKGRKVIAVLRRATPDTDESLIAYTIKFRPYEKY